MGLHFLAFWPCRLSFPCILAFSGSASGPPPQVAKNGPFAKRPYNGFISAVTGPILQFLAFWAFISFHFCLLGLPSIPCILTLWAFISLHFGLVGLHFLAFWPCGPSFPFILAFSGSASGAPPTSCQKWPVCPTSLQWIYQRRDRPHFAVFSILGLHFLAFWPCGPSFPCILALWAFISLHFGLVGLHFLSFWPFRGRLLGPPPPSCQKWPVCPTSLQWIYQHRGRLHFAVFSILGLHFLAFWACGPSFPCILALWAFISLHFGLVGLHFLSFWRFRGRLLGPPPTSCQKWPVCQTSLQWIYQRRDRLHFAAFISLHFGLVGLHFLAFWPCGPSFPCILALWAFISFHFGVFGVGFWAPPQVAKNGPFAQRPYNGFISAVTGPMLQFLAFWAFISLHFGLVGLHFLAFWPCGPSFPCILALWAFISLHFGLVVASLWAPPTSCQKRSVFPMSHIKNLAAPGPASFSNFWPFGPSFPFILAFWAFILHLAVAW